MTLLPSLPDSRAHTPNYSAQHFSQSWSPAAVGQVARVSQFVCAYALDEGNTCNVRKEREAEDKGFLLQSGKATFVHPALSGQLSCPCAY